MCVSRRKVIACEFYTQAVDFAPPPAYHSAMLLALITEAFAGAQGAAPPSAPLPPATTVVVIACVDGRITTQLVSARPEWSRTGDEASPVRSETRGGFDDHRDARSLFLPNVTSVTLQKTIAQHERILARLAPG